MNEKKSKALSVIVAFALLAGSFAFLFVADESDAALSEASITFDLDDGYTITDKDGKDVNGTTIDLNAIMDTKLVFDVNMKENYEAVGFTASGLSTGDYKRVNLSETHFTVELLYSGMKKVSTVTATSVYTGSVTYDFSDMTNVTAKYAIVDADAQAPATEAYADIPADKKITFNTVVGKDLYVQYAVAADGDYDLPVAGAVLIDGVAASGYAAASGLLVIADADEAGKATLNVSAYAKYNKTDMVITVVNNGTNIPSAETWANLSAEYSVPLAASKSSDVTAVAKVVVTSGKLVTVLTLGDGITLDGDDSKIQLAANVLTAKDLKIEAFAVYGTALAMGAFLGDTNYTITDADGEENDVFAVIGEDLVFTLTASNGRAIADAANLKFHIGTAAKAVTVEEISDVKAKITVAKANITAGAAAEVVTLDATNANVEMFTVTLAGTGAADNLTVSPATVVKTYAGNFTVTPNANYVIGKGTVTIAGATGATFTELAADASAAITTNAPSTAITAGVVITVAGGAAGKIFADPTFTGVTAPVSLVKPQYQTAYSQPGIAADAGSSIVGVKVTSGGNAVPAEAVSFASGTVTVDAKYVTGDIAIAVTTAVGTYTVSGGDLSIVLTKANVESFSGDVVFYSDVEETESISMNAATVKELVDNFSGSSLTFKTSFGSMKISTDELKENFSGTNTLAASITEESPGAYTVTLENAAGEITSFENKLTIALAFDLVEGQDADKLYVVYMDESTRMMMNMNGSYADGFATFETDHLSTFSVVFMDGFGSNGSDGDSGNTMYLIAVAVLAVLLVVVLVYFLFLKK